MRYHSSHGRRGKRLARRGASAAGPVVSRIPHRLVRTLRRRADVLQYPPRSVRSRLCLRRNRGRAPSRAASQPHRARRRRAVLDVLPLHPAVRGHARDAARAHRRERSRSPLLRLSLGTRGHARRGVALSRHGGAHRLRRLRASKQIGAELKHPLVWVRFAFTFAAGATLITGGVPLPGARQETARRDRGRTRAAQRERAERINAEEARARAERTAQEVQHREALGRLASGIAHDFNNTLTVVLSWAELLHARAQRDGAAGDAKMVKGLGAIVHTAEHAGQFTRQLLSFARREPGP